MEGRRKRKAVDDSSNSTEVPVKSTADLPSALKTREKEFAFIKGFLTEKMRTKSNGYLFISGTPGLGKTATVKRVIDRLNSDYTRRSSGFKYIELNGLFLSEPSRAYSRILEQMTEEIATPSQALDSLKQIFSSRSPKDIPVILFIDEFDCIYKKSPKVVNEILELHLRRNSQLSVITIANDDTLISTLKKAFSGDNIKIDELMFGEYSNADLEIIVADRLQKKTFEPQVIEFIVKKCAVKKKDARITLDICDRILNKLPNDNEEITLEIAKKICEEISSDHRVVTIRSLAPVQKVLLRVIRDECSDTESSLDEKIYFLCKNVCAVEGVRCPSMSQLCCTVEVLARMGFLITNDTRSHIHSKIRLNSGIQPELINTALHMKE